MPELEISSTHKSTNPEERDETEDDLQMKDIAPDLSRRRMTAPNPSLKTRALIDQIVRRDLPHEPGATSSAIRNEEELEVQKKKIVSSGDVGCTIQQLIFIRDNYADFKNMFERPLDEQLKGFKGTGKKNRSWFKQVLRPVLRCYELCSNPTENRTRLEQFILNNNKTFEERLKTETQRRRFAGKEFVSKCPTGDGYVLNLACFVFGCGCEHNCPCKVEVLA